MDKKKKVQHLYWRGGFGPTWANIEKDSQLSEEQALKSFFKDSQSFSPLIVREGQAPKVQELRMLEKEKRRELIVNSRKEVRLLNEAWLDKMVSGKAQLREKMAFFWHGHFACQCKNIFHAQSYLNTLRKNALGKFGDLVLGIAREPAMLQFLNNQQNRKRSPNENFARELMELFTLGRGNYMEKDVKESARAFTGWGFDGSNYVFRERLHDTGSKTFMGKTGNFNGDDIIRMILAKKETAQFMTRKIYAFFVNEEVNEAHVKQLAERFYDSGYDIKDLMYFMFSSSEFYADKNVGSMIKSPVVYMVGLQRNYSIKLPKPQTRLFLQKVLGQMLFMPPNVAGWPGGKAWIDSSTLMVRLRMPEVLYRKSALAIQAKAEGDVQKQGLVNRKLKDIQAEYDWSVLYKYCGKTKDPNQLYDALSAFLLSRPAKKGREYVKQVIDIRDRERTIQTIAIALSSLPEYQLC